MNWYLVERTDTRARLLADRHYSRQSPGHPEFCPPGHNIVLIIPNGRAGAAALWVSHRPAPDANLEKPRADGMSYWDNPYFRNESNIKSSMLIREALAVTRWLWRDNLPADGFHSFVDPRQVRGVKVRGVVVYGFVFQKAGFVLWPERTKSRGLLRWYMPLTDLLAIAPCPPKREQLHLFT
jgi:hypothetical protein